MLIAVTLLFSAAANAADPPAPPPDVKRAATAAATPAATTEPARAPLKLQIGDVRKYMMPNEYRAAINAPDAERTTIVVEGERPVAPLQSELPLPSGLAAYYTLFRHPTKAWRLLLPDPNGVPAGPPDVVPQREFRWGP
jgi:hypothetical protein